MKKQVTAIQAKSADVYFNVAEVADRLKISTRQVRRLIDRGDLPTLRIGRSVRINFRDLLAFEHRACAGH